MYAITANFPREELFGLSSQLRRAAVSIAANIAEGFVKRSKNEKLRFYNIAHGSLEECRYYLRLALDLKYADTTAETRELAEISRMFDAYQRAIAASRYKSLAGFAIGVASGCWLLASGFRW